MLFESKTSKAIAALGALHLHSLCVSPHEQIAKNANNDAIDPIGWYGEQVMEAYEAEFPYTCQAIKPEYKEDVNHINVPVVVLAGWTFYGMDNMQAKLEIITDDNELHVAYTGFRDEREFLVVFSNIDLFILPGKTYDQVIKKIHEQVMQTWYPGCRS